MPDDITIRLATADDAAVIVRHRHAMFFDMGYTDAAELAAMDAAFAPYVERALRAGAYLGWLAHTADGRVVAGGGLIVHEWPARPANPAEPRRAYILNVYTEPEFRGRGISRGIMREILAWCGAQGFRSVSLHGSKFGRPLYESLGFEPTNEMRLRL
jgi:GNAT superfamily N-acetyltransferase